MSDALDSFLDAPSEPASSPLAEVKKDSIDSFLDGVEPLKTDSSIPLPDAISKSEFSQDIVPELSGRGEQGFDEAVRVSGGDIKWALKAFKGVNPDVAARVEQLAKSKGVPFNLALDNKDAFEQQDEAEKLFKSLSELDQDGKPKYPSISRLASDPVAFAKSKDSIEGLKQLVDVIRSRKPVTAWDKAKNVGSSIVQSFDTVLGSGIPKALSHVLVNPLDEMYKTSVAINAYNEGKTNAEVDKLVKGVQTSNKDLYQAGQFIEDTTKQTYPMDPRLEGSFAYSTLPQATGSMLGFIGGGVTSKALSLPGLAFPLVGGALLQGSQAYDEAKAAGADDDTAYKAFLFNLPGGATEAIPLGGMIDRFGTKVGVDVKQKLIKALVEGSENTLQEIFQQGWGNAVAKKLYDEDRGYWDGLAESGAAGGITGFVASLVIGASGGKQSIIRPKDDKNQLSANDPELVNVANKGLAQASRIQSTVESSQSEIEQLDKLKQVAEATPVTERDPDATAAFITENLKESGQDTTTEVNAKALSEVLFQEGDEDQKAAEQFAQDMG
jgi:hypothetical protein